MQDYEGIERNFAMPVKLSIVVPVKDEVENIAPLAREIAAATASLGETEIIFVDDGSSDGTAAILVALKAEIPTLRVVSHAVNRGQSRATRTGVRAARGEIVVTLDGDGQNDPADIPNLVAPFDRGDASLGMVSGVRAKRRDTSARRIASKLANAIRQRLLNDGAVDSGCGLKAFRREAFLALPYFDHLHRFMIAMMLREGYRVEFIDVNHRPRLHGASKYTNFHRMLVGITDLVGVRWLQRRMRGTTEAKEL
jgi:glycosyltransferase involved in cell wall biosynthesis